MNRSLGNAGDSRKQSPSPRIVGSSRYRPGAGRLAATGGVRAWRTCSRLRSAPGGGTPGRDSGSSDGWRTGGGRLISRRADSGSAGVRRGALTAGVQCGPPRPLGGRRAGTGRAAEFSRRCPPSGGGISRRREGRGLGRSRVCGRRIPAGAIDRPVLASQNQQTTDQEITVQSLHLLSLFRNNNLPSESAGAAPPPPCPRGRREPGCRLVIGGLRKMRRRSSRAGTHVHANREPWPNVRTSARRHGAGDLMGTLGSFNAQFMRWGFSRGPPGHIVCTISGDTRREGMRRASGEHAPR